MARAKKTPVSEPAPYNSPTAGIAAKREPGRNAWRFETLNYLWWFEPADPRAADPLDLSVADRGPEEPEWVDLAHCGDLEHAIQWACGYERGACNPKRDVGADLENALESKDLDGVLYLLTQIVVNQRNDENELVKKGNGNPAQAAYLQKCVELLSNAQERAESL